MRKRTAILLLILTNFLTVSLVGAFRIWDNDDPKVGSGPDHVRAELDRIGFALPAPARFTSESDADYVKRRAVIYRCLRPAIAATIAEPSYHSEGPSPTPVFDHLRRVFPSEDEKRLWAASGEIKSPPARLVGLQQGRIREVMNGRFYNYHRTEAAVNQQWLETGTLKECGDEEANGAQALR